MVVIEAMVASGNCYIGAQGVDDRLSSSQRGVRGYVTSMLRLVEGLKTDVDPRGPLFLAQREFAC